MRVGLQGRYTFDTESRFMPWVGLGVGYEWRRCASGNRRPGDRDGPARLRGEPGGGRRHRLSRGLSADPFATFNLGQFQSTMTWVSGLGETVTAVKDKRLHEWLHLRIKGTFDL